jgi:hypothetical protein
MGTPLFTPSTYYFATDLNGEITDAMSIAAILKAKLR